MTTAVGPASLTGQHAPMSTPSPFGADTERYWQARYALFSRFDEGIALDREGLFSVKPEAVAFDLATRLRGETVLDAFCGVGGSAIGFARAGKSVVAVDTSRERLDMARTNAAIYGVAQSIEFVHADALDVMTAGSQAFDAIYLDPPWGGPDYWQAERFTLAMFAPDANGLLDLADRAGRPFALTVPKNFNLDELKRIEAFRFEWSYLDDRRLFGTVFVDAEDRRSSRRAD